MSKQKDSVNRLSQINSVLREMLVQNATESLISERFRPLPQRYVERQQMADQFRLQRIMQNFSYNQARRDYMNNLRFDRDRQRMDRGQARWQERFDRGPAQPPQSTTAPSPSSTDQPVTPPSARDDWYNEPKPNEMSKSSDWRRFIPQYPDSRLTTPATQMPSSTVPPPPASEQQPAGFGQIRPSELDQNTRGGTPTETEQQRRDKNEAEMKRRMAAQGVPSDEQRLATARAEQERRGVRPNQNASPSQPSPQSTATSSVRQDMQRKSATAPMAKPAGGF